VTDAGRALLAVAPFDYVPLADARRAWRSVRVAHGLCDSAVPLLTPPDANLKYAKTEAAVYGLSLAPAAVSGWNVCRFSTPECRSGCVASAGKGGLPHTVAVRIARTAFLLEHPEAFATLVMHEVGRAWAEHGIRLRVRMNGFSDLLWEKLMPELFSTFPLVRFYDYTKHPAGSRTVPANYHLTYSASERTDDATFAPAAADGQNTAVVFSTKRGAPLPGSWHGVRVVDGDKSDDRTKDPAGVIVGLRAKGAMRSGDWGMVREVS
jgi:hypothetical protein